jgi:hypothetical protein
MWNALTVINSLLFLSWLIGEPIGSKCWVGMYKDGLGMYKDGFDKAGACQRMVIAVGFRKEATCKRQMRRLELSQPHS